VTWEIIGGTLSGTASDVSVAWRRHSTGQTIGLVISVREVLLAKIGATRAKRPLRLIVERNKEMNRIRISVAAPGTMRSTTRGVRWAKMRGIVNILLPDVHLTEVKPSQDTPFWLTDKHIEIKLPHWAGTGFIQVAA